MAEPAVLRRSFSNPSETSFQEGDALRALGESISFGRYMSESLAWEKWSTFSHNRYLEEAEKYSRPGSVAKMKAYFEAHYKKIGAKKQAAQEQANNARNNVEPEVEDTRNDSSSLNPGVAEGDSHSTVQDFPVEESPDVELPPTVVVSSCGSCTETIELQSGEANVVETGTIVDTIESPVEAQVYQCKDLELNINVGESTSEIKPGQLGDALESNIVVATPESNVSIKKEMKKKNLVSKSKQESTISSVKRSSKSHVSKLSSSLARLATPIRPKEESSGTPKGKKSAKEPPKENKPASTLHHMSINSDANLIKKASLASRKTRIGKVFTPLGKIIRESFAASPAPSRASVNSVPRHPSATPHTETRRRKLELEKSFDKSRKLDQKLQTPLGNMKCSTRSPAPTVFSSFNFRTEERAAKRRELFHKRLEKEAENMQLQDKAKQVKPKPNFRKSCVNPKADLSEDIGTEVLSNNKNKILPRRTESPKRGSNLSSDLARGTCSRPPQMSNVSKPGAEKAKVIPTHSSTPLTKKKRYENASPNIL